MMIFKKLFAIIMMILLLVLQFQNCTRSNPITFSGDFNTKAAQNSDGGSVPYDGKIFILTGDQCQDGSYVHSRIFLKFQTDAILVRDKCQDIIPTTLSATEFQFDSSKPGEMFFRSQTFVADTSSGVVGSSQIQIAPSNIYLENGFMWGVIIDSVALGDSSAEPLISRLQIYEDGKALGPAHSMVLDIQNIGHGRFSHWQDANGPSESLSFSTSDNSDPRTNGRIYTYSILP